MKRIDKLLQQREALDKRIKEISAKENEAKRKEEARRKIIIGAWVIEHRPALVKEIIANLVRDQDKAAFHGYFSEEDNSDSSSENVKE